MLDKIIIYWYSVVSLEKESQRPTSTSKWFAPSKEMHKIQFLKTQTGDATLIDRVLGGQLESRVLVDCGIGPDYQRLLAGQRLDHLLLTHAHLDHWTALLDVLRLPSNAPKTWLSGTIFSDKLMYAQQPFAKAGLQFEAKPIIDEYLRLYRNTAIYGGYGEYGQYFGRALCDLNEKESTQKTEVSTSNHRRLHQGCIVTLIALRPFSILLGADLNTAQWSSLYSWDVHFPRNIDVLQAPGHGRQPVKKEILAYLNPRYVVISTADSDETANISYYRSFGAQVFCLNRGDVVVDVVASNNDQTLRIEQK